MSVIRTAAQRTHLSAHRTVDGDDDETLDGVKDGEENLEETNGVCDC